MAEYVSLKGARRVARVAVVVCSGALVALAAFSGLMTERKTQDLVSIDAVSQAIPLIDVSVSDTIETAIFALG